MKLTDEEILELHDLFNGLVEKNLAPAKLKSLEDWLLNSSQARQEYVAFMDMSTSLAHYAEEIVVDEDDLEDELDSSDNNLIRFFRPILAIAAIVVIAFTLLNYKNHQSSSQDATVAAIDDENNELSKLRLLKLCLCRAHQYRWIAMG